MKFVTYSAGGAEKTGILEGTRVFDLNAAAAAAGKSLPAALIDLIAAGAPALETAKQVLATARDKAELWTDASRVKLLAPIPHMRKNVFCVGRNYKAHIEEGARARGAAPVFPPVPELFSKPPTSVIGNDDEIEYDTRHTKQLDYEVELAIVIGPRCKNLTTANALDAVFGYTVVNDVSAREVQRAHGQWFKGKSMDTYCPIGPCIVTKDEFGPPSGHRITLRVNGQTRQDSTTSDLLFSCEQILESLSAGITLEPGDIIATGTPSGVALGMTPQAWLQDGDVVEAEVEGIGVLRNKVKQVA